MYYVTGDIHGNLNLLKDRCQYANIQKGDTVIILGDVGANFYTGMKDEIFKKRANDLGILLFCIHGNHEIRPENLKTYHTKQWNGGTVYYEDEYPNLIFAMDGQVYDIEGIKTLVVGGAYSVDKYYRIYDAVSRFPFTLTSDEISLVTKAVNVAYSDKMDAEFLKKINKIIKKIPSSVLYWWKDEQMSYKARKDCEQKLKELDWKVDVVLSHTCPLKFEPTEMFLEGLNQDFIDKTMEKWLNKIENKLDYKIWYAGHFHTNKTVNKKFQFLFSEVQNFAESINNLNK